MIGKEAYKKKEAAAIFAAAVHRAQVTTVREPAAAP